MAAVDIKKLKEGGINTIECLAFASKRELCEIKGMSDAKVAKIKEIGTWLLARATAVRTFVFVFPFGLAGSCR